MNGGYEISWKSLRKRCICLFYTVNWNLSLISIHRKYKINLYCNLIINYYFNYFKINKFIINNRFWLENCITLFTLLIYNSFSHNINDKISIDIKKIMCLERLSFMFFFFFTNFDIFCVIWSLLIYFFYL